MINYLTITPQTCTNVKGVIYKYCLPEKIICYEQNTDGLIAECDMLHNCIKCQSDSEYYIPFYSGDKIMLQLQLTDVTNSDKKNPTSGFGTAFTVKLIGSNGTITDMALFLSRKTVSYGCKKSFQTLEIDTSLFDDQCFKLEISNGVDTYCSQEFSRILSCINTLTLESLIEGKDCLGNCYERPTAWVGDQFNYSNKIRIKASLINAGISMSIEGKKKVIRTNKIVRLGEKIPQFMLNYLVKSIFSGPMNKEYSEIWINGELYYFESFSTSNKLENTNMFLGDFTVFTECDENGVKCR